MEQNEKKTNPFLKALKAIGHYFKFVFADFIASFKYNTMKLPAILIAIPGIFLGFFLIFHIPTVRNVIASYTRDVEGSAGEYVLAADDLSPDSTLYYKLVMDNFSYEGKTYNLVLRKKFEEAKEGTKLPTPTGLKVSFTDEKLSFTINDPEGEAASSISGYNVFIYQSKNGKNYVIKSFKNHALGTDIEINDLAATSYSVSVQAVSDSASYISSDLSSLATLTVSKEGAKYNAGNYTFIEYAGAYYADEAGLTDDLKSYVLSLQASGDVTIHANDKELEAKFSSNSGTKFTLTARETIHILPFNYSGMILFVLMLLGILNIFFALSVSGKKNLGSVIKSAVVTGGIVICGIFYIIAIVATENAIKSGDLTVTVETIMDNNAIMSITFVVLSMVTSIAGCILGFIFYDRNYEKVTY